MAGSNINRVIITGNLTRDPDLRAAGSTMVCSLRIACNGRRKDGQSGQWVDVPNYFDVTVWGAQGENCAKYLTKGRGVAIDGRLQWREWEDRDTKAKRQAVDIVAETVQFLGGGGDGQGSNGNGFSSSVRAAESDIPIDTDDFVSAPVGGGGDSAADDDIPF
jgi:single-strand DNA-binding protein